MFKLMISYDCGMTYREEQAAERIDLLDNRCKELDEQGWRWTIQDEKGEIIHACKIHMDIIAFMTSMLDALEGQKGK